MRGRLRYQRHLGPSGSAALSAAHRAARRGLAGWRRSHAGAAAAAGTGTRQYSNLLRDGAGARRTLALAGSRMRRSLRQTARSPVSREPAGSRILAPSDEGPLAPGNWGLTPIYF